MKQLPSLVTLALTFLVGCATAPRTPAPPLSARPKSVTVKAEIRHNIGLGQRDFIFPAGVYPALHTDATTTYFRVPPGARLDPKARNTHGEGLYLAHDDKSFGIYFIMEALQGNGTYRELPHLPIRATKLPPQEQAKIVVNR